MQEQISILGNRIDCFRKFSDLYGCILHDLHHSQKGYVTVNNVHTMIEGFWNPDYQKIINGAYLSIADGKPLEIVGRLKGNKNISRLFGPSVMEKFIDWGRKDGVSHFFFGGSEDTLQKLKKAIEDKYPGTKIAGMVSPPYKPLDQWDHENYIGLINTTQPDFIWIGLGAPKQEYWMYQHHKKISTGIMFGIGAGFDYVAGNTRHAPNWMKTAALEWLYRLIQEPKRLWKRYLKTIPQFIFFAFLELIGLKFRRK
jgi:N-acetylglucosaminyldiphosphoundecaprenol N-acetyl-beta-D-mannosaminyltransferase